MQKKIEIKKQKQTAFNTEVFEYRALEEVSTKKSS